MGYEIPKNLTRYAEEFLFGLSLKQFGYAAVTVVLCFIIFKYLGRLMSLWVVVVLMLPIVVLGVFFVFLDLENKIRAQLNMRKSLAKTGYFDRAVSTFVDVADIKDDVVLLKNGTMLGLLEVKPIDFFMLGKEDKQRVLAAYEDWLRSIDYHVQILSRSVDIDLDKWLASMQRKMKDQERSVAFGSWMTSEMEKHQIRNRLFYVVIPQKQAVQRRNALKDLAGIFTGKFGIERTDDEYERALKELRHNLISCTEMLTKCRLASRRLPTDELLGLYASYFTNQSKINKTVLSPFMDAAPELLGVDNDAR